jgi:hypothetical protein
MKPKNWSPGTRALGSKSRERARATVVLPAPGGPLTTMRSDTPPMMRWCPAARSPAPWHGKPRTRSQFTVVRRRPDRTGHGHWSSLNRSGRPRPELLIRLRRPCSQECRQGSGRRRPEMYRHSRREQPACSPACGPPPTCKPQVSAKTDPESQQLLTRHAARTGVFNPTFIK